MTFKRFILRTMLATLPVWAVVAIYVAADPFNVLRFDSRKSEAHAAAGRNMGVVTINTFLNNNERRLYDSFIFGSSMSQNFRAEEWAKYLPSGSSVLHADATMETIDGIVDKIRFFNSRGTKVANALIVIEEEMLRRSPLDDDILHVRPPSITSEVSALHFHTLFFNAYKNPTVIGYCLMPKRFKAKMEAEGIITTDPSERIDSLNEYRYNKFDSLIAVNPDAFYTGERLRAFEANADVMPQPYNSVITERLVEKLKELRTLLKSNDTKYVVIIPPRYKRRTLSGGDLLALREILGEDNVKDYSHDALSRNPRAYYDKTAHLTAANCTALLKMAYSE